MDEQRVVLVTGVSGYWGSRVAQRLLDEPGFQVIGLDGEAPSEAIAGLDFVHADVRNPLLAELLQSEGVDTVCHLAFQESRRLNEAAFDYNVMGTMKVIGAAAESGVRQLVWKSSTLVYGAGPDNTAFLKEDAPLLGNRDDASIHYRHEIEAFLNGYRRQAPEMALTVLRFAHIVGPSAPTRLNRYLRQPLAPMLLGFDPLLQVVHEDDVVEALVHAVVTGADGCFNVAAEPPLPLLRIIGLAGKVPVPLLHPLAYRTRLGRISPLAPDFLRYRCVADLTAMREELGYSPQYSGDEAIEAVAVHGRIKQYRLGTEAADYDRDRLRATIERRRRQREQSAPAGEQGAGNVAAKGESANG
ncbi:MAG: NAD-dependent epimerase/dehydratase family protein [Anaerolineae bacterium]|nr:NAD-dependent epimerase/dehydratase family protein [Anaerolineae bacterium]